ncbi:MAG: ADP-forming succinate--CoA ligase subunit beta [Anaerolineae bacterium]
MNIHEYQAKEIFVKNGLPVPMGEVATTADEAQAAAEHLGKPVVVKAQVLVGGRGKAGGVKLAKTPQEAREKAAAILGMNIKGITVKKVLVAPAVDIAREIYLGMVIDRAKKAVVMMASAAGGVDIEEVARDAPEKIIRVAIDPILGLRDFQARDVAMALGLEGDQIAEFTKIARGLYKSFWSSDASLAEVNPLVVTPEGHLLAIDAKMNIDDSALFRHPDLAELRDEAEETPEEQKARVAGLSYVALDGNIGCLVNGAGLAMATMDTVKLYGGEPANFLDIGGGARADKVFAALSIILSDPKVKAVLVNIFGGITRVDEVAKGILQTFQETGTKVPFVVRLVGTNEDVGREMLAGSNVAWAASLSEAAQKAVKAAETGRAEGA